ncbi:adenylyl-sulfate kinase [Gorillibacterium massiliense]|uniref:adenylyl-sulfate kinase n=1 Tax=Gorillibacterium massiliense TaxID=1280390 RepID=UPI0004B44551|nr:adenylyl-sulfate kinase [Gorillibacterium massiliense]
MTSNVVWENMYIDKLARQKRNGHKSGVLWFTGLSGSGKATLVKELDKRLFQKGVKTFTLDGDNLRSGLNNDLGFSQKDRQIETLRTGEVSKLFVEAGVVALTALISPYRSDREKVRSMFAENEFIEVHVKCPLEICEKRDPKGLYKKAIIGEFLNFTGLNSTYEPPLNPELTIETNRLSVEESVKRIMDYLVFHGFYKEE